MANNLARKQKSLDGGTGTSFGILKRDVEFERLNCKQGEYIPFRILPAYNPQDLLENGSVNPRGALECRYADGTPTEWGALIEFAKQAGRGIGRSGYRRDVVCATTFDDDAPDLYLQLLETARALPEWEYLTKDIPSPNGGRPEYKPLPYPSKCLIVNMLKYPMGSSSVKVGILPPQATKALMNSDGLFYEQINLPNSDEVVYVTGDLTSPEHGPVLAVSRPEQTEYTLVMSKDPATGRVRKAPVPAEELPNRYDMREFEKLINFIEGQDLVNEFVKMFNSMSPTGMHEHHLLQVAFGSNFDVPTPPSRPAASTTVQSGFEKPAGAAPAAPTQPAAAPAAPAAPAAAPAAPAAPAAAPAAPAAPAAAPAAPAAPAAAPAAPAAPAQPAAAPAQPAATPTGVPGTVAPEESGQWLNNFLEEE